MLERAAQDEESHAEQVPGRCVEVDPARVPGQERVQPRSHSEQPELVVAGRVHSVVAVEGAQSADQAGVRPQRSSIAEIAVEPLLTQDDPLGRRLGEELRRGDGRVLLVGEPHSVSSSDRDDGPPSRAPPTEGDQRQRDPDPDPAERSGSVRAHDLGHRRATGLDGLEGASGEDLDVEGPEAALEPIELEIGHVEPLSAIRRIEGGSGGCRGRGRRSHQLTGHVDAAVEVELSPLVEGRHAHRQSIDREPGRQPALERVAAYGERRLRHPHEGEQRVGATDLSGIRRRDRTGVELGDASDQQEQGHTETPRRSRARLQRSASEQGQEQAAHGCEPNGRTEADHGDHALQLEQSRHPQDQAQSDEACDCQQSRAP